MPKNKTLSIPLLPELDEMQSADEISARLDAAGARGFIGCANWAGSFPYRPLSSFVMAHTGRNLYIDFFTRSNFLRGEIYEDLGPVCEDSCVEFFVEPRPGGEYWNFEFNCIGTLNASHRAERPSPTRLTAAELASVRRHPSCGTRPFKELEGIFSWNLLVSIPLELIGVCYDGERVEMRGNFYKCASATSQPHFLSWNPIDTPKPDFHRPEFFGTLILE
ncbi:MAG: hypothetical protein K2L99_08865 [Muribaculaceae bacterium]|nr:hypothetical protein [Muribaculaceae bacterium]